jgi:hypothetical protein
MAENPLTETLYVIREVHRAKMFPEDFARETIRGDREIKVRDVDRNGDMSPARMADVILEGYLDNSAFGMDGTSPISRGKQMNNLGCKWKPVEKWPGSRIAGIQEIHRRLGPNPKDPEGLPGLRFFDTCVNAIRTIPTLPRSDKDVEDIMDGADDHDFDSLRYCLQWRFPYFRLGKFSGH